MIRKIIALCLVLMFVSAAFTGCKKDEPVKPKDPPTEEVDGHEGHDHGPGEEH